MKNGMEKNLHIRLCHSWRESILNSPLLILD